MEDDLDMLEDDFFCFPQINKDSLNPFKYPEMIKNYERKMIDDVKRMEGDYTVHSLQRMTYRLWKMTLRPINRIYHLPFIVPIISEHSNGFRLALLF